MLCYLQIIKSIETREAPSIGMVSGLSTSFEKISQQRCGIEPMLAVDAEKFAHLRRPNSNGLIADKGEPFHTPVGNGL